MHTQEIDVLFLRMADEVKKKSLDPSTKVGAVLVPEECWDERDAVVGFNDIPHQLLDEDSWTNREKKYSQVVHAEMHALLGADAYKRRNATMYTSFCPCDKCAIHMVSAGVKRLVTVYPGPQVPEDRIKFWTPFWGAGMRMLTKGGISVTMYSHDYSEVTLFYPGKENSIMYVSRDNVIDFRAA